jgi:fructose-1,6-bisphosphatase/inositol monophosphatase family enzyme
MVAQGTLDGWVDMATHGVWDYLASVHICLEAGAVVGEVQGRGLIVTEHAERRSPIVAGTPQLLAALRDVRTGA